MWEQRQIPRVEVVQAHASPEYDLTIQMKMKERGYNSKLMFIAYLSSALVMQARIGGIRRAVCGRIIHDRELIQRLGFFLGRRLDEESIQRGNMTENYQIEQENRRQTAWLLSRFWSGRSFHEGSKDRGAFARGHCLFEPQHSIV